MRILVTGGTGYIGSHTTLELLQAGHDVVVMDNLANSSTESLNRVQELTGRTAAFVQADLLDPAALEAIFTEHSPEAVIHFAGLKAVGESVAKPLHYYRNNVAGTLNLLTAMDRHDVRTIVFSSSATVYGASEEVPLAEDLPMDAVNPYGRTKEQIEDILTDLGDLGRALEHRPAALLQPGGRTRIRTDRRRPHRCSQQPAAVRGPGRSRATGKGHGLRQRLPHT